MPGKVSGQKTAARQPTQERRALESAPRRSGDSHGFPASMRSRTGSPRRAFHSSPRLRLRVPSDIAVSAAAGGGFTPPPSGPEADRLLSLQQPFSVYLTPFLDQSRGNI
jgi:hypothetical protein